MNTFIGVLRFGPHEVEVDRESSGHYTFSAVGEEALPFAVDLAHLQARSFRGDVTERWRELLKKLGGVRI